ncbi:hypothetical protein CCR75_009193 [Bremia lactucae]|uniref:Uncharacterized protein n=1 Tax=Bremia lactucae TaxID=4779 RepID=A0A976IEE0_BRELC|nr:hypothetical protein CCR75_009193 [Bremia lactucae]
MDTTSLRYFALRKLQEAKERGTELAAFTAARAASSINLSVPDSSSFVFRAQNSAGKQPDQQQLLPLKKLESLKKFNDSLRARLLNKSMDECIYKLNLINESLAFSIENIQEGSHVMKLLNRQFRDTAAMEYPNDLASCKHQPI